MQGHSRGEVSAAQPALNDGRRPLSELQASPSPTAVRHTPALPLDRSLCVVGEEVVARVTVVKATGSRIRFDTVITAASCSRTIVDGTALAIMPSVDGG